MRFQCTCPEYMDNLGERPCENPNEDLDCQDCPYGKPEEEI